jgi:hypothetical protein
MEEGGGGGCGDFDSSGTEEFACPCSSGLATPCTLTLDTLFFQAECDKLRSANRPHEALEAITACLKLEPFNIRMLRKRVILCQSMQDWDTCKRDCATILKWYAVQRKGHNNSICKEALAVLTSIDKKESQHAMGMTMTVTTMSASRLRENSLMPLFNEALTTSTSTAQLRDHYNAPFTDSRFGY